MTSGRTRTPTLLAIMGLLTVGCGPTTSTKTRYEWKPYDDSEFTQTKDGVTVENKLVNEYPPSFYAELQACDRQGVPLTDAKGKPVMKRYSFAQPGQLWFQVAITNETDHIIRLNRTVTRLFDPAGNQYEPLTKEDLMNAFLGAACPTHASAAQRFKLIKVLDRNAELLPKTTVTGWLAFQPSSLTVPGAWKLSIYEVPVATDEAGTVTRTANFDLRMLVKKFIDTYRREGPFSRPELVSSKEATN